MPTHGSARLSFSLTGDQCARLHDALACLVKFSDVAALEGRFGQVSIAALNSSKSAYACVVLRKDGFLGDYHFAPRAERRDGRFSCRVALKALLSVFKSRSTELRAETPIESCEVWITDGSGGESSEEDRVNITMTCRQGITKRYNLIYEEGGMLQAVFDRSKATNQWRAPAHMLREYVDFFGAKTEHLDIGYDEESERAVLTSFTEKVQNGREVLKQPLETAVTIETSDFDAFTVEDASHVTISVRDFRHIIMHAAVLNTQVAAAYSRAGMPLQLSYGSDDMRCEFTLMTMGDSRVAAAAPEVARAVSAAREAQPRNVSNGARAPVVSPTRQDSLTVAGNALSFHGNSTSATTSMNNGTTRRLGSRVVSRAATQSNAADESMRSELTHAHDGDDDEGLFVRDDNEEDEKRWDPVDQDGQDQLAWDTSEENTSAFRSTLRDQASATNTNAGSGIFDARPRPNDDSYADYDESGIEPTQRLTQAYGLFDNVP